MSDRQQSSAGLSKFVIAFLIVAYLVWMSKVIASSSGALKSIESVSTSESIEESNPVVHVLTVNNRDIYRVTLDDGTRCAVLFGVNSDGVDCDWASTRATAE